MPARSGEEEDERVGDGDPGHGSLVSGNTTAYRFLSYCEEQHVEPQRVPEEECMLVAPVLTPLRTSLELTEPFSSYKLVDFNLTM